MARKSENDAGNVIEECHKPGTMPSISSFNHPSVNINGSRYMKDLTIAIVRDSNVMKQVCVCFLY